MNEQTNEQTLQASNAIQVLEMSQTLYGTNDFNSTGVNYW